MPCPAAPAWPEPPVPELPPVAPPEPEPAAPELPPVAPPWPEPAAPELPPVPPPEPEPAAPELPPVGPAAPLAPPEPPALPAVPCVAVPAVPAVPEKPPSPRCPATPLVPPAPPSGSGRSLVGQARATKEKGKNRSSAANSFLFIIPLIAADAPPVASVARRAPRRERPYAGTSDRSVYSPLRSVDADLIRRRASGRRAIDLEAGLDAQEIRRARDVHAAGHRVVEEPHEIDVVE
jgi:hypothetical protein